MSIGEKVFSKLATFLFKTSRHTHGNYCIRLPDGFRSSQLQTPHIILSEFPLKDSYMIINLES